MVYKSKIVAALLLSVFALMSCEKDLSLVEKQSNCMISELASIGYIVDVNSSDYHRLASNDLDQSDEDSPYNQGLIEYYEQGDLVATIDFSIGEAGKAIYKGQDGEKLVDLKKDADKGKGDEYSKVIIEPLVKSADCSYVVAGIIKFYDSKTQEWAATFDYGDGTCDAFILKTTADGYEDSFSMDDYPEWN